MTQSVILRAKPEGSHWYLVGLLRSAASQRQKYD